MRHRTPGTTCGAFGARFAGVREIHAEVFTFTKMVDKISYA